MPNDIGKIHRKVHDPNAKQPMARMQGRICNGAMCLALTLGWVASTQAAQTAMAPASAAGPARVPFINPAILQVNAKIIPTPTLVYVGDYAALAPVSSSPLRYAGDYAPLAPVVTGVLVYLGAGSPGEVSLPAFMTPKQIATGVLTYVGDYATLPNPVLQTLTYTGAYQPMQAAPLIAR